MVATTWRAPRPPAEVLTMWICYTVCDDHQRYAAPAAACTISFDPAVLAIVIANLDHVAKTAEEEGNQVADAVQDAGADQHTVEHIREHAAQIAASAERALRRSRLKAEAFIQTPHARTLVCHVHLVASWAEVMKYTGEGHA
jgi:hypothetical protein